ncbi:MAG: hypothetical protein WBQ21_09345 [Solirubrobacteraceae bacterium]
MVKLSAILVLPVILLLIGCGSSSTSSTHESVATGATDKKQAFVGPGSPSDVRHVVLRRVRHLGLVLVDGYGRTLYAFVPEKPGTPTCTGACATVWPPFYLAHGIALDTTPLLSESRVSLQPGQKGGSVVAYAGWVLHTYAGDTSPGVAGGQDLSSYGGHWHVISPTGKLVTGKR